MQRASATFRVLADPTRLRLLRVLAQDRFNVSELTMILGLAQSGVSRHLGLLKDAGLVEEERESGFVYYRLALNGEGDPAGRHLWPLLEAQFENAAEDRAAREDEARLQDVLRRRKESFYVHGDARQLVPGRSWAAWARALGHLLPPLDVADIGCGEGYLTVEAAAWARTVVGVDRSDDVLERAKALAARRRVTNIEWKKGDLARLPLHDASVDVAILSQSLRYAADPERAVAEAVRILRPRGRLVILELKQHDQEWVRARFGDQHLGFAPADLDALLRGGGLADARVTTGANKEGSPFTVLIASAIKPAAGTISTTTRGAAEPSPTAQDGHAAPRRAERKSQR
jgi:ArsR family transcriptional regulator